ncbi:periplasmic divalent manganese/zinc-binding lipoprotein [Spirochaetia bacterium]|nr:periplasmic divalent manganese/zinc-binding lipoprotein [Spirochaetia bacterium]
MKIFCFVLVTLAALSACSGKSGQKQDVKKGISVVTTIFPPFDFVRSVAGTPAGNKTEGIQLTMLLKPGSESHSYEPTPQDIITIQNCDVFIYVGGESDDWVNRVLNSLDKPKMKIVTLMDCVELVEEEIVEGMEVEEEEEEKAYDEHVWTSPRNAKLIVQKIAGVLCEVDAANAARYRINMNAYLRELDALDAAFREIVREGSGDTLIFADRFPFRYFTETYGLKYYAAFPGCSTETEPSAATVAFLINKVRAEKIPVVFTIEFSNGRMADAVTEASGAEKRLFHSAHNISRDELAAGVHYLGIMRQNTEALRAALR